MTHQKYAQAVLTMPPSRPVCRAQIFRGRERFQADLLVRGAVHPVLANQFLLPPAQPRQLGADGLDDVRVRGPRLVQRPAQQLQIGPAAAQERHPGRGERGELEHERQVVGQLRVCGREPARR